MYRVYIQPPAKVLKKAINYARQKLCLQTLRHSVGPHLIELPLV